MKAYSVRAAAKINLYLEIVGDRPDGFHELATIFQSVDLSDRLTLHTSGAGVIHVDCDHPDVPTDASNLAHRAADLMARRFPAAFAQYGGVAIALEKIIPAAAGLAGGSADAAAVLVGLDLLWKLGLTRIELQELAAELGSDVPFCVAGGTAIATGRGEVLDTLPSLQGLWVVLAKHRRIAVPTPWAYQTYREQFGAAYARDAQTRSDRQHRVRAGELVQAMEHYAHGDRSVAPTIGRLLHNDFERVVLPAYPAIATLRSTLATTEPLGVLMSGSGPTVFALYADEATALAGKARAISALQDPDVDFWCAPLIADGIRLA